MGVTKTNSRCGNPKFLRLIDQEGRFLGKEKAKAVCAAKFATQRLLDTVADFQRQVEAQKKVQLLLTRMLHEKDEQLRLVTSRVTSFTLYKFIL